MTQENKTALSVNAEKYSALSSNGRAYIDGVIAGLELQLRAEDDTTPEPTPAN